MKEWGGEKKEQKDLIFLNSVAFIRPQYYIKTDLK